MEKLRDNILFQYSITVLLVIALVAVALGFIISGQQVDNIVRAHIELLPAIVGASVYDHPEFYRFFHTSPRSRVDPELVEVFRSLTELGSVFRIKIWSADGTIIWSDREKLIGSNFSDNEHFQAAMSGKLTFELAVPDRPEQATEREESSVLEIYIPIIENGENIGVLELYEGDSELFAQLRENIRNVWLITAAAGAVLYLLLFIIFYNAYRRQKKTSEQLIQTQDVTIFALAYQAELRDKETGRHLNRTSLYVRRLAEELAQHPGYRSYLGGDYITDLVKSTPLHDIGKVGISDSILLKPGKLTPEELDIMKRHCEIGAQTLRKAEEKLTFQSFLKIAVQIAQNHHEKWNGSGYPQGLSGEEIPLSARIMALADVYDALRTERPYKPAFSHEKCRSIIQEEQNDHFDPEIVDVFMKLEGEFRRISEELAG